MSSLACLDINDQGLLAAEQTPAGGAACALEDGRMDAPALAGWKNGDWIHGAEAERLAYASPHLVCDRHWHKPSREAVDVPCPSRPSLAQLACDQLAACLGRLAEKPDCLGVVAPASWGAAEEGMFGKMCAKIRAPVSALLPSALVHAAAWLAGREPAKSGVVLVAEVGRNGASVSKIAVAGEQLGCEDRFFSAHGASAYVRRALREAAVECVRTHRMDPLREPADARAFRESVHGAMDRYGGEDALPVALDALGQSSRLRVPGDRLAAAAEPLVADLFDLVGKAAAGHRATVLLAGQAAALPGFRGLLSENPELRVAASPRGGIALAGLRILARLGCTAGMERPRRLDRIDVAMAGERGGSPLPSAGVFSAETPTHLVVGSRLIALPAEDVTVVLGLDPDFRGQRLVVGQMGGRYSRQLCHLHRRQGAWILRGMEQPAAEVNGLLVSGEAAVGAGDRVRMPGAGVELLLVRAER